MYFPCPRLVSLPSPARNNFETWVMSVIVPTQDPSRSSNAVAGRHHQDRKAHTIVRAGLFDRAGRVARGNVNYYGDGIGDPCGQALAKCLSRKLSPSHAHRLFASCHAVRQLEDPNKMLDTIVSDIQADLVKMRQASAEVRTTFAPAILSSDSYHCHHPRQAISDQLHEHGNAACAFRPLLDFGMPLNATVNIRRRFEESFLCRS